MWQDCVVGALLYGCHPRQLQPCTIAEGPTTTWMSVSACIGKHIDRDLNVRSANDIYVVQLTKE
jgi:hypothetical protein